MIGLRVLAGCGLALLLAGSGGGAGGGTDRALRGRRARRLSRLQAAGRGRRGPRRADARPPQPRLRPGLRRPLLSAARAAGHPGHRRRGRSPAGAGGRRRRPDHRPTAADRRSPGSPSASPQISLNFGAKQGWSYISGGFGVGQLFRPSSNPGPRRRRDRSRCSTTAAARGGSSTSTPLYRSTCASTPSTRRRPAVGVRRQPKMTI